VFREPGVACGGPGVVTPAACVTSKVPGRSSVATLANSEIITTECALTIMTCHATLRPTGGMMIERFRSRNLPPLRHSRSDLMAFIACNLLMLCMTKADTKCLRELRRPGISSQLMTGATRRNITTVSLCARSVAPIAGRMRVEPRRDRHGDASTRWPMTRSTVNLTHLQMKRVIELHSEALQTGECLQRSRLHIGVTNGAKGTF
jgi:hypothetical protein